MKLLVRPKKPCCKSNPRCKRCPVVLKRLEKKGYAKRRDDGLVLIKAGVKKKHIKAARKR